MKLCALLLCASATAQTLYKDAKFQVSNTTNIKYAQALKCPKTQYGDKTGCTVMDLLLDIYEPVASGSTPVPKLKPAYILAHGGANSGGSKEQFCFQGAAEFYAARGFVGFNIDYRLAGDHGLLPPQNTPDDAWSPNWVSGYPAIRDCKAAVRFVRANAAKYGVDPSRIVVSGGSAGATDMITSGVVFDGDYKDELTQEQDPTLASTNPSVNSSIQCVVTHCSSNGAIDLIQQHDPKNRSRYSAKNAPVIEFHGDKDGTIPIAHAQAVQKEYAKTGVPYQLHVLSGCAHGAWCYDGKGTCGCTNGVAGYGPLMDTIALPFVAKNLGLHLQD